MYVSRDGHEWSRNAPFMDIDDDFHYRVEVHNNFINELRHATVVGVLPTLGDSTTAPDAEGVYHKRGEHAYGMDGSTLHTYLTGPLETHPNNLGAGKAAERFTFSYLTEKDIAREKLQEQPESAWKTAAEIEAGATTHAEKRAAWAKVTAWRATLKEGQFIPGVPESKPEDFKATDNIANIFMNARVENVKERATLKTAVASPAYKVAFGNGELSPGLQDLQEGIEPTVSSVRYVVSGTAFLDGKRTGAVNNQGVAGVQARLVYAHDGVDTETGQAYTAGTPVPPRWVDVARRRENGFEVTQANSNTATTDASGAYAFIVYKRGAYTVEFTRPTATGTSSDNLRFIQCPAAPDTAEHSNLNKTWASDVSAAATANSVPVTVHPGKLQYAQGGEVILDEGSLRGTRNAALTDNSQPLTIRKLGLDKNGKETSTLSGAVFTIYKRNGDTQGEKVGEDLVTGQDGTVTSKPLLPGDYFLEEKTPAPGYEQPRKVKVTLRASTQCARMGEFSFANETGDTDATADLFSFDPTTGVTTVKNKPRLGTLSITKLGKGGAYNEQPMPGVTFALLRDGHPVMDNTNPAKPVPRQAVTGSDGVATFADIAAGSYTVKEVSTLEGYSMIDPGATDSAEDDIDMEETGKVITIPDDPTLTHAQRVVNETIHNKAISATVRFVKVASDSPSTTLAGAVFTLTPKDAAAQASGQGVRTVTTGSDGVVLFENVAYGVWTVEETQAPRFYRNLEPAKRKVDVAITDGDRIYNPYGVGPLKNDPMKTTITIKKVAEEEPTKVLQGAAFNLYTCAGPADDAGISTCTEADHGDSAQALATTMTGTDGLGYFRDIRPGRYVIKEYSSPYGYHLNTEPRIVDVALNGDDSPFTVTIPNKRVHGTLTAKKVDAVTGEPIKGAKFNLIQDVQGDSVPHFIDDPADYFGWNDPITLIDGSKATAVSDENGLVTFIEIPAGNWFLKEVEAPSGYEGNATVSFRIDDETYDITYEKDGRMVIKNTPILSTVKVVKKGGEAGTTPLPGATFELHRPDGSLVGTAKTTDTDGIALLSGVPQGTYTLKETSAPTGHQKVADQTVEVRLPEKPANQAGSTPQPREAHVVTVEIVDPLNVGRIEFTKVAVTSAQDTDLSDNAPLPGATFSIFKAIPNAAGDGWEKSGEAVATATSAGDAGNQPQWSDPTRQRAVRRILAG